MNTIYIRTLKRAEHTVFCVADGQKTYYDPQFNRYIPYSSGQQIKRSLIDTLARQLNQLPAPTTFIFDVTKKKEITEGEVFGTCDPSHFDQLLGGWMKASKGGKEKTIKRRSPLSISAMRALHPLLAGIDRENITFDRSDRPNNTVIVRDPNGKELCEDDIITLLQDKDRSLIRKWIPDNKRATGLFVQDIAIDLRRLFCVTQSVFEPEITKETEDRLKESGWLESNNIFGNCLVAPPETRNKLIPAIAKAIINWRITSNQSRTFSLMETLAVSISTNANKIAGSIRAKLSEEDDKKAIPVIEEDLEGVETFVTLSAGGYFLTKSETAEALEDAEKNLIDRMMAFDYEDQIIKIND
ncbi:CRISPR-associated protein Cas7 [Desulfobacula phenolica]|uniref:CRISPR-associated protein Cas7 n=1 Tax=Desulfobacula phenolica TaxID=90732 RepID=A0A1H2FG95_9BACT|nr:CRISPR-associated protein Cas7 [Desulfobacula phenolica]SDU06381.1 hypothetical protein SAMN04487931_104141 [Desulfobacula phenolica]